MSDLTVDVTQPRVVVTGLGVVSPIGIGAQEAWEAAKGGRSGAGPITRFDASDMKCQIVCEVTDFEPTDFIEKRSARRMDRFAQMAVAAGKLALEDARLTVDDSNRDAIGAMVGSGIGGLQTFIEQVGVGFERGADRMTPLFIPMIIPNMAAAHVSMQTGIKGPLSCVATACATGNHSIGEAISALRAGHAEAMLAGGTEAGITEFGMASFDSIRALSHRNDDPGAASRPFEANRDGFVMGEGSAILVLETLEHALGRGAPIYAEAIGYGMTGDAHHLTEPDPTGQAPANAMSMAMRDARITPDQVGYLNAHATATPVGDRSEVRSIQLAFGEELAARLPVSSTKSMHGHLLGGAGGLEGVLTALALRDQVLPPTTNLDELDPGCAGVDHIANEARRAEVHVALSNGFGFGGHNAVVALSRWEDD
jgi:3-oxoacyl-[acyl-carrier-protein] synthase II